MKTFKIHPQKFFANIPSIEKNLQKNSESPSQEYNNKSEKCREKILEKVTNITRKKYNSNVDIWWNKYVYYIERESKNSLKIATKHTQNNKKATFFVVLDNAHKISMEKNHADNEVRVFIDPRSIHIQSIVKDDRSGKNVYANKDGQSIKNFGYFKFLFNNDSNLHSIFLKMIQDFLLQEYWKNNPENEI